ncbi:MAG: PQQ-dependent sugar dehydrogenase [Longimicrobiales bacterium]|nr:PQQ-dependent sugar dehydrogenase [Longimicrobiales bacterium]
MGHHQAGSRHVAAMVCVVAGAACGGDTSGPDNGSPPPEPLAVETVVTGLDDPVHLTAPPGDERLFVVEQPGRIRIIEGGQLRTEPFLDISDQVRSGGEQGLLSVAFHPDYAANGRFVVDYTDLNGDTRIEEYSVSGDPNVADPASARLILSVPQPYANHNGGLVVFGPDGYLWIGMGDGGSAGDPLGHGQDSTTLLGSLLRIDVDGGDPYAIPPDNPFAGGGGAPEVWAYGLRNPWRYSFDASTGRLYIADVGQNAWEEVHLAPAAVAGLNYGWNILEGSHCFNASSCDTAGLELPVLEYSHDRGCSITGGHVYRGSALDGVRGHYFYGDYCDGWIASFRYDGAEAVDHTEYDFGLSRILSFGRDAAGELYVLTGSGAVYRLVPEG